MQLVVHGALSFAEVIHPAEKKTLVILPGWGQDSRHWTAFVKRLPSEYRYLILDLPGFGQTQHLPAGAGVDEYVEWLHEFCEKADLTKPNILGHSFGGQVAVAFAAKYPEKLSTLLLLSPSALRNKTKKVQLIEQLYRHFRWLKRLTPGSVFSRLRPFLASDDYHQATPEQKQVLSRIVLQDQKKKLSTITAPTYILWGEKDTEIPYGGKILAESIKDAHLTVLYGADHTPQLTAPEKLANALTEILDRL